MKLLYNITFLIEHNVHDEWKNWMISEHIPSIIALGNFNSYKMSRILGPENKDGINYAVQFVCPSAVVFEKYRKDHAQQLAQALHHQYGEKCMHFETFMEIVSESDH